MSEKDNDDNTKALEYFHASIDKLGVAATSVADGHIFGFSRKHLQAMLDKNPTNEKFLVFVQHPKFKN